MNEKYANVLFKSDKLSLNIRKRHCNFNNNMNSSSGFSIIIIIFVIAIVVVSVHTAPTENNPKFMQLSFNPDQIHLIYFTKLHYSYFKRLRIK